MKRKSQLFLIVRYGTIRVICMDRRQRKTEKAVFDAVGRLLERKSYSRITVQEIIDEADIGRTTFYAHFPTKDDLLSTLCERLFDHVFSSTPERERTHDFSSEPGDFVSLLCHILYHIRDEHEALHILRGDSRAIFIDYLRRRFSEIIGEMQLAMEDAIPRTYVINQLSSNFASSLEWWIADDMRTTPECLAGYFMAVSGHLIYDASLPISQIEV